MKILCLARGYASYGGALQSSASDFLEDALGKTEPLDLALEVTAYTRPSGPARPTLEALMARHLERFPHEVRARYFVKSKKLLIEYPSALKDDDVFGRRSGVYAVAHNLPVALSEICDAIVTAIHGKPQLRKLVNLAELQGEFRLIEEKLPSEPDLIREQMQSLSERRKAQAKSPETLADLDIDWDRFHSGSKLLLDDPFFWSEIDDDAPHGNDTGADLLSAFARWQKRNPNASTAGYVDRIMNRWGFTKAGKEGRIPEDQYSWIRGEAGIALAFAQIKHRGYCQPNDARTAIEELEGRIAKLSGQSVRIEKHRRLIAVLEAQILASTATHTA